MSDITGVGRTEGFATLELQEGLRHMNIEANVYKSEKKVHDPTKMMDDPDATRVRKFEYDALPGQTQKLTVHYSYLGGTYWKAEFSILENIQKELKVRYAKDHPDKPLQIIKAEDIDPTDYYDPFFAQFKQEKLDVTRMMRGGVYTFKCADPIDRLLFYAYMYHPDVEVSGGNVQTMRSGRKRWRLLMPEVEKATKVKEGVSRIEAISMLDKKRGIEAEKQLLIAKILKARINFDTATEDDVRIALLTQFIEDNKRIPRWKKDAIDVIAYLGEEISSEKLQRIAVIDRAMEYNLIARSGDTYRFNEETIDGVSTDPELFEKFTKGKSSQLFRDIEDLVKARDNQLDGNIGK